MGAGWQRFALIVLAWIVSGGSAFLAVRGGHLSEVRDSLASTTYVWLLPALATFMVANVLRVVRWRFLFAAATRPAFLRPPRPSSSVSFSTLSYLPGPASLPAPSLSI